MILLALATWLLARSWRAMRAAAVPGAGLRGGTALAFALLFYLLARQVQLVSWEGIALYLALVAALYLIVGWPGLKKGRFALFYLLLALPLPDRLLAVVTPALRYGLTGAAVNLLDAAGYVVARTGMRLYVDQYEIAIVDACSGINSLISLTAIGLFYIHARARRFAPWVWVAYALVILGFAVFANFVRVLAVVLMTHYFGNTVAQGPLHEAIGFITFAVALGGVIVVDALLPEQRR